VIEHKDLPPEVLSATPELGKLPASAEKTAVIKADWAELPERVSADHAAPSHTATADHPAGGSYLPNGQGGQGSETWESGLETEAMALLASGRTDVWDVLTRRFESRLIQTALQSTRGRRIEAAQKLGIGRNTITRKIQELHLE
jgi:two-component system nitrogen regulation response regulator GlnG